MSSNHNECPVKMVRIIQLDKSETTTYDKNVIISTLSDISRQVMYLRIKVGEVTINTTELSKLQWISESSTDGVATIRSPTVTMVIIHNARDGLSLHFFANLQRCIERGSHEHIDSTPLVLKQRQASSSSTSVSSQSKPDQLQSMISCLIRSIDTGSLDNTESMVHELAKKRVNIQFRLLTKNDNHAKEKTQSKSDGGAESTNSFLQLTLRIECQMKRDPIIAPIKVRSGTTLQSLKQRIEKETGIKCADQYWFAFDRYPISNEYVFGSLVPVGYSQTQYHSLVNPIRSGDTLIMYITQTSSVH